MTTSDKSNYVKCKWWAEVPVGALPVADVPVITVAAIQAKTSTTPSNNNSNNNNISQLYVASPAWRRQHPTSWR